VNVMASSGMVLARNGTSWKQLLMVKSVATIMNLGTLLSDNARFANAFLEFMAIMVSTSIFEETKVMRLLQSRTAEKHAHIIFPLAGKHFQQATPILSSGSQMIWAPTTYSFDQRLQPTFAQTNCLEDGNVDGKLMESLLKIIAANWFVKVDFIGKPTTKLNSRDPRTILFKKKLLELVVGEGLVLAQTDQFIKSVTISIIVAVWHVSVASADYAIDITESGRTERSPAASPLKQKISSINFSQEQNVVQDSNQLHHLGRIVKKQEEQLV